MTTIVTDTGFAPDTFNGTLVDLASDTDPTDLDPKTLVKGTDQTIRIHFASFADGRGFTLARLLRLRGFSGRLRASGHVIADQYAMARRAGFDEVEISDDLAARQPQDQWLSRSDWRAHDHQSRLRG